MTLEQLLQLDATNVAETLNAAAHLVGEATSAEKVDLFLYHPENHTLQVAGLSNTPMSKHEVELGLDRLAIADGGRVVEVFQTGEIYATGHADQDPAMLRGITEELGVRSLLAAALDVGGERRGVLQAASALEDAFSEQDRRFFEAATRWVGLVVHRAELVEQLTLSAAEEARRLAADELITVLAHDLGNLVTPLSLRLQLLRRKVTRKSTTSESEEFDILLANVARLQGLIMNLLDTARLDHGLFAIEPEMCDLTELVTATAAVLSAPRTPIEVHGDPHVIVQADPARLRQVIENLLENALQHTRPGTPVAVSVDIEPKEITDSESATTPEWATLVIQDHGPGIPRALLARLFERYVKGQHSLGVGLGLYVSYRIIEAHGGTLTADSIPGQGARFTIRLPLLVDS
ncbi:MAG TPA: GAF domain-containing sensor histidine kinase [Ktedonobacterales bacterium]|nr:GAF domain-containing sensor histidine kinase [Ktedonobacterales bacterium]